MSDRSHVYATHWLETLDQELLADVRRELETAMTHRMATFGSVVRLGELIRGLCNLERRLMAVIPDAWPHIPTHLRFLRTRAKLTHAQLAQRYAAHMGGLIEPVRSYGAFWERFETSTPVTAALRLSDLIALTQALGCTLDELVLGRYRDIRDAWFEVATPSDEIDGGPMRYEAGNGGREAAKKHAARLRSSKLASGVRVVSVRRVRTEKGIL